MLGYIATDAAVDANFLQEMLSKANAESFSCITVDGDTSTSDTVLLLANPAHAHISSSLVREVASLGGEVADMLPEASQEALTRALAAREQGA